MGDILVKAGLDLQYLVRARLCVSGVCTMRGEWSRGQDQACLLSCLRVMQRLEKHEHVPMGDEFRVSWNQDRVVC